MKSLTLSLAGAAILCASPAPVQAADTDYGQVAMYVADMLQKHHYSREDFNDSVSARLLDTYLDYLDFSHQYFTGEDIAKFNKLYRDSLDGQILVGDVSAATAIYDIFEQRVKDRAAKIRTLLESEKFTFDSERTVHVSRKKEAWPANDTAADELWRNIIEGELLQEKLRLTAAEDEEDEEETEETEDGNEGDTTPDAKEDGTDASEDEEKKADKPEETPEQRILKRYTRFVESLDENSEEDVVNYFLTSLASAYDPHSDWFSQSELENFQISMKNSLFGIGALLQAKDDGTAEIQGLVLNGPAQRGSDLKVGDRIVGVGQGDETEIEDTVYMRLQKVVEKIRGKKGSTVVLKVANPDDLSITREIAIVRDEVQLKDKLATAQVIDTKNADGETSRFGWIELPAFYADMDERKTGATQDVAKLLERLM
ncbi:MAG: PDZ domain-containing protein, partial [Verrucomicrobiales bacterium]|nr:PDZ domain-containing protein [Verrucomicrobiales bacterium]